MSITWTSFRSIALKTVVFVAGMLSLTYVPYLLLGMWNRVFGGWRSVFYCYAGSEKFIDTYAPGRIGKAFRWFPVPIGILRHERELGLVLASPVSEKRFLDKAHAADFDRLQRRIRRIARLIGAEQINLAGILPGIVRQREILSPRDSRTIVQRAVVAGALAVRDQCFGPEWPPVILIGGAGYVGAPVAGALRRDGVDVHVVDPRGQFQNLPKGLRGRPCLVIDISRKGVIDEYVDQMWPGMVLLNEVFPQPSERTVRRLSGRGVECWHLSGLAGAIFPPLPHGYENAVPCCAAHSVPDRPEVRIVKLADAAPVSSASQTCRNKAA